jgi:hypothetical protein
MCFREGMHLFKHFALIAAVAAVSACAAETGSDEEADTASEQDLTGPNADEAKACDQGTVGKNSAGDTVLKCTKPFADAEQIHLPADSAKGTTVTFYGAMTVPPDSSEEFVIWSRDGSRYLPVDTKSAPIRYGTDASKLPKTMHAPTMRSTFTIYQFTGTTGKTADSPYGTAKTLQLTAARPVVELDGCAFDSRLAGTWDGTVSQRLVTPTGGGPLTKNFDETVRVPIHLTLDTLTKDPNLSEYKGGARIKDATSFMLNGTIDNFDKDVTLDGKHYPSLSAMGAKNPFKGASDGKVQLYRLGNMHGLINDGHWVFTYPKGSESLTTNGMSFTLTALTAASIINPKADADPLGAIEIKPHIPFTVNGHSIVLSPIKVGAKTGQCPAS